MQRRIAQGLTLVVLVGLGAAQGPTSSGSASYQNQFSSNIPRMNLLLPATRCIIPSYQIGTASWYGDYFEGKPTASGEPFNMYDLTAAHPTLPLGTLVKVTNLRNRESVIVRVNDRGPVVPGRIIDVSYGVAVLLHFNQQGLQRVRLDVVRPPDAGTRMAMLRAPVFGR
jgi:rare lipoprotein A